MVFRGLVGRVLGVVLVMLVKRMWAFEGGCALLGKRNGVSVGETGGGAQAHKRSAPPFLVFARVFTRVLVVVYLCGSRMVVWVAAASPLTTRPLLCSMVRPWCAVRPL